MSFGNDGVVVRPQWAHQVRLLVGKQRQLFWLAGRRGVMELVFPCLLVFLFNTPNLGNTITPRADPNAAPTVFNVSTLPPYQAFLGNVYPPPISMQYSADWQPFYWSTNPGPRLWWAPAPSQALTAFLNGSGFPTSEVRAFASENDMMDAYSNAVPGTFWAGVVIHNTGPNWHYSIRLNGTYAPDTSSDLQAVVRNSNQYALPGSYGKYFASGFLTLQAMVDKSLGGANVHATQRLPIVVSTGASVTWILRWLTGWCLNIGIMFYFNTITVRMVFEKEQEITRGYLLMGVSRSAYWAHWAVYFSMQSLAISLALAGILYLVRTAYYSSFGLVFIWMYLFMLGLVALAMLAASAIDKTDSITSVGLACVLTSGACYVPVAITGAPSAVLVVLSLFPWFASFTGGDIINQYDYQGLALGITTDNVLPQSPFGYIVIAQACSVVVLFTIAFYRLQQPQRATRLPPSPAAEQAAAAVNIEDPPTDFSAIVDVRDLVVGFGPPSKAFRAVDGLSLRINRGEVFTVLGHNGAGKTTTMSAISGELAPSSGAITFTFADGATFERGDQCGTRIGVCPQRDVIYDVLTARQHLTLFAALKGASADDVEAVLGQCGLAGHADRPAGDFSGGMKRKVTLAMALLGRPELVFLDEPTAGMDPVSRRSVWDMILAVRRQGTTVVLTTHFMDEADLLSDRIAIVRRGRRIAQGSPLFLKNALGVGYTLTAVPSPGRTHDDVARVVASVLPNATATTSPTTGESPADASAYALALGDEPRFATLLRALDDVSSDVSLQLTSLEDVFLSTARESTSSENPPVGAPQLAAAAIAVSTGPVRIRDAPADAVVVPVGDQQQLSSSSPPPPSPPPPSPQQQEERRRPPSAVSRLRTLVRLQVTLQRRNRRAMFFSFAFPAIILVVAFVVGGQYSGNAAQSPAPLDLLPGVLAPAYVGSPARVAVSGIDGGALGPPLTASSSSAAYRAGGYDPATGALLYNSSLPAAASLMLSALSNATLVAGAGSVRVRNAPLPFRQGYVVDVGALLIPMLSSMAFAAFAYVCIQAAVWRHRHLSTQLRLMGVSWRVQLLSFALQRLLVVFPFVAGLALVLAFATGSRLVGDGGRWLAFVLLLVLYAGAVLPFSLMLLPLMRSERQAVEVFPLIWNVVSIVPFILIWVLSVSSDSTTRAASATMGNVLTVIPSIAYQTGIQRLLTLSSAVGARPIRWSDTFSADPGTGVLTQVLVLAAVALLSTAVVLFQTRAPPLAPPTTTTVPTNGDDDDDDDENVRGEHVRAADGGDAAGGIRALRLVKEFNGRRVLDQMSIAVARSELFVLLGPNGAGKTTTMRVLTGEEPATSGRVHLGAQACATPDDFRRLYASGLVGYCPQFDALFPEMSASEHLVLSARLRGLPLRPELDRLDAVGLEPALHHRPSAQLSGGGRRKISLALALSGDPGVLLLDEPSTGLDPASRRVTWQALKAARRRGAALILSTHVMEEAEALATRVGIAINGRLRAVGTPASLSAQFCAFLSVEISSKAADGVVAFLEDGAKAGDGPLQGVVVVERVRTRVRAQVPRAARTSLPAQLADLFHLFQGERARLHIDFYSIAQMNLEQIFVRFATGQMRGGNVADVAQRWSTH
ncbi:unnamed protein product (mitochondrion) [Plasmodiophora brassicae]|uniref:ABC transporter domain-containing protein n=1 Tax=Plasmodiophora brassicae TaxID=37360 RepID=A0A3P3YLA2_PLABS|nr:unnamed protein product [Plasmodiophora brassicae]